MSGHKSYGKDYLGKLQIYFLGIKPKVLDMLAMFHQWATISPAPNLLSDPLFHPKKYNIYSHIYVSYMCVFIFARFVACICMRQAEKTMVYLMNEILCCFYTLLRVISFLNESKGEVSWDCSYLFEGLAWRSMNILPICLSSSLLPEWQIKV